MQNIYKDFAIENNLEKIIKMSKKACSTNAQTCITFDLSITSIQGKIQRKGGVLSFPEQLSFLHLKIPSSSYLQNTINPSFCHFNYLPPNITYFLSKRLPRG